MSPSAARLAIEYSAIFIFLLDPTIDATTGAPEQALQFAVIARKVCGGNRTDHGAHTQEALTSVLRTIQRRQIDAGNRS